MRSQWDCHRHHVCVPAGDEEEWHAWKTKGDPVLHIELRKWADAFVIAPLSANSLAKIAQGLCDNCLTSVARAWDFSKPMLVGVHLPSKLMCITSAVSLAALSATASAAAAAES